MTYVAWQVANLGEPREVLQLRELEDVNPGPTQVVLRPHVCGLNFADILLCRGTYQDRPALPFTPGSEVVASVVEIPDGASISRGDRVLARLDLPNGGLAQQCLADLARCYPLPDEVSDAIAVACHVTYQTAWFALHRRARLRPHDVVLIHAAAGATGSAAVQLAVDHGCAVIGTAGGTDKVDQVLANGAHHAIDYQNGSFVDAVLDLTHGRGADVIIDPVGGETLDRSRRCVAFEGRIVIVGFASGQHAAIPSEHVFVKNYDVIGVQWPAYEIQHPDVIRAAHRSILAGVTSGTLRPIVGATRPFSEAPEALSDLADRQTSGKVVIDVT